VATIQHLTDTLVGSTYRVTWDPLTFAGLDEGSEVDAPDHTFKEIQVFGDFGAGGNVVIEGSLDGGTTWATLNDVQGNALNVSAAKIERVQESTARIRPRVSAGDATTDLTVVMIIKLDGATAS